MDIIDEIMSSEITFWILVVADVILVTVAFYAIFLFRKDVYDFEKKYKNQFKN